MRYRLNVKTRVNKRISNTRQILSVNSQRTRRKLIYELEEIFELSSVYARGRINWVTGDDGKPRPLTIVEKQFYARIAAYTVQIINSVAKAIDERQIIADLDKLEQMLNETPIKARTIAGGGESPGKSEDA